MLPLLLAVSIPPRPALSLEGPPLTELGPNVFGASFYKIGENERLEIGLRR